MDAPQLTVDDPLVRLAMVARGLSAALQADEIVAVLVNQGMSGLHANGAVFAVVDADVLVPVAGIGDASGRARSDPLSIERLLPLSVAVSTGLPVWVRDREEAAARCPELVELTPNANGWAAIPLIVRDEVLGVVAVTFETPQAFGDADRSFLITLAGLAAGALSNCPKADVAARRRAADGKDAPVGAPDPEDLARREEMARVCVDSLDQGVIFASPTLGVERSNPATFTILGHHGEEP